MSRNTEREERGDALHNLHFGAEFARSGDCVERPHVKELRMRTQQLINGAWVDAVDGGRNDVIDPATEQVVANVPFGGAADVVKAIDADDRAFAGWKARTAYDRGA